ncbi:unnamed protein product [Anisakis simplex]|uniref:Vang-like protein n=1 Tax=Anisakis simplex TaxID=6269 RepID=A0A158PPD9_ANISI|nr:unnamed protein product [Anisakis simplex]
MESNSGKRGTDHIYIAMEEPVGEQSWPDDPATSLLPGDSQKSGIPVKYRQGKMLEKNEMKSESETKRTAEERPPAKTKRVKPQSDHAPIHLPDKIILPYIDPKTDDELYCCLQALKDRQFLDKSWRRYGKPQNGEGEEWKEVRQAQSDECRAMDAHNETGLKERFFDIQILYSKVIYSSRGWRVASRDSVSEDTDRLMLPKVDISGIEFGFRCLIIIANHLQFPMMCFVAFAFSERIGYAFTRDLGPKLARRALNQIILLLLLTTVGYGGIMFAVHRFAIPPDIHLSRSYINYMMAVDLYSDISGEDMSNRVTVQHQSYIYIHCSSVDSGESSAVLGLKCPIDLNFAMIYSLLRTKRNSSLREFASEYFLMCFDIKRKQTTICKRYFEYMQTINRVNETELAALQFFVDAPFTICDSVVRRLKTEEQARRCSQNESHRYAFLIILFCKVIVGCCRSLDDDLKWIIHTSSDSESSWLMSGSLELQFADKLAIFLCAAITVLSLVAHLPEAVRNILRDRYLRNKMGRIIEKEKNTKTPHSMNLSSNPLDGFFRDANLLWSRYNDFFEQFKQRDNLRTLCLTIHFLDENSRDLCEAVLGNDFFKDLREYYRDIYEKASSERFYGRLVRKLLRDELDTVDVFGDFKTAYIMLTIFNEELILSRRESQSRPEWWSDDLEYVAHMVGDQCGI